MKSVISEMAMPPTDGMAIGCITSEPRPSARNTGIRPMTVVAVVIRQGRMRFMPASTTMSRTSWIDCGVRSVEQLAQVGGHHDAVVLGHAEQGDEADPHRDAQVEAVEQQHEEAARGGDEDPGEHQQGHPPASESQVEQHEVKDEAERNEPFQAVHRPDLVLELARPLSNRISAET